MRGGPVVTTGYAGGEVKFSPKGNTIYAFIPSYAIQSNRISLLMAFTSF